jgi:hypothetical protein
MDVLSGRENLKRQIEEKGGCNHDLADEEWPCGN